jgi:hypothetical protein
MAAVAAMVALPTALFPGQHPEWVSRVSPAWGLVALVVALAPVLLPSRSHEATVAWMATAAVAWMALLHVAVARAGGDAFDVRPVAVELAAAQRRDSAIAHVGPYHGQYHYYGRLRRPLEIIEPDQIERWSLANPEGMVVVYLPDWRQSGGGEPVLQRPYRGRTGVSVWDREAVAAELAAGRPRWVLSCGG